MELDLATTEEIIKELMHRSTFVGVIVHSTTEHLGPNTHHTNFNISSNLVDEDLQILLKYLYQFSKTINE